MANTRDIRRKIKSVGSTMQITSAFELVSSAKLRRARNKLDASKPYFEKLRTMLADALGTGSGQGNLFLKPSKMENPLVIVLTSDRGLCGGFNSNATKSALEVENAVYYCFGKKGADAVRSRSDITVVGSLNGQTEKPTFEAANRIDERAVAMYRSGEVDGVILVYSKFVSTISFAPTHLQLLPLVRSAADTSESEPASELVYFEPGRDEVISMITPKYVASLIYGAMIESSASEQAARRLAMEAATGNAQEIIEELTLTYNQARQAAITQEISEIVGGAEALS